MPLRAAVIGAGICGLISIKQCLDDDIEPVCFEAQGHIGGQWRYTEPDPQTGEVVSSIYRSVVINTSRETMNMSDFPMDSKKYALYPHHTKVQEYFEDYTAFFNLRPHIRFHQKVLTVTPLPGNKWRVETVSSDGAVSEELFDAVFVCTGHHTLPNVPEWEGVKAFENNGGQLLHSHYYRDPARFIGKKVAVVGVGNSGVDISSELSSVADEVHLITRSGAWVWPRFIFGRPYEAYLGRFCMTVLPTFISLFMMQMILIIANGVIPAALKPKHSVMGAHPTVRSDLFERIETGTVQPHRASISRFTETGIELTTGEKIEPLDAVVACTGYRLTFPYIDRGIYRSSTDDGNWNHLYRMIVPPEYPTMFFIGLVQPLGAIMPVAEQQTRWATGSLLGQITLPSSATMHKHVESYKEELRRRYVTSSRHTIQVDYLDYSDILGREIGNSIHPWRFITTFGLWQGLKTMRAAYFGAPTPSQYRLFGRGSKSEVARLAVQRVYNGPSTAMSAEEKKEVRKFER